jgi:hypothetical protein
VEIPPSLRKPAVTNGANGNSNGSGAALPGVQPSPTAPEPQRQQGTPGVFGPPAGGQRPPAGPYGGYEGRDGGPASR